MLARREREKWRFFHTFGPLLFIWYLLANVENEENKRMQKKIPSKIYTSFFKSTNGGRGSALKRELIPIKTDNKGKGEVLFCKLRPGTAVLGDDKSPEMHAPSLQPHEIHRDYVNVQPSDCRLWLQML